MVGAGRGECGHRIEPVAAQLLGDGCAFGATGRQVLERAGDDRSEERPDDGKESGDHWLPSVD
ncbi:hypothetical protein ABZZ80_31775 [Streptomyces sp. NPDC006356]